MSITEPKPQNRQERYERRIADDSDRLQRLVNANGALVICHTIGQELDAMIPRIEAFMQERIRLGEYDASAKAIIAMAEAMLKLAEYQRQALQAQIDFALAE